MSWQNKAWHELICDWLDKKAGRCFFPRILGCSCKSPNTGNTLTHLHLDKIAAISQTMFWDAFSWMKSFVFRLKFHWSLFLRGQLTKTQHGLDNGFGVNRRQAIIRSYQCQSDSLTHICALRGRWVKVETKLKFHWNLFLRVQSTMSHHWFR